MIPSVTRAWGFSGFVIAYATAAFLWWTLRDRVARFGAVIAIALLLRLAIAFAPPLLSTDVYRYLWDGTVLSAGFNPYQYAPDDPRLAALRPTWHSLINHRDVRTIYPPHAELLFAAVHNLAGWRALLIGCDLLTLFLLRRRTRHLLAVAAFPPLIVEGIWSAHVDAMSAMLMTRAVIAGSGVALAMAAGLKLIPLAAVPAMMGRTWRQFLLAFALIFLLPFVIFAAAGDVMPGLRDFATRWVFNSPLYSLTTGVIDALRLDVMLKDAWTVLKDALPLERVSDIVYRHLYTDFIARCVLALLALTLIVVVSRHRHGAVHAVGALLVCSPVIHPWYWLTIAPLAVADRIDAWRFLALFAPLSYLLYDGAPAWAVFCLCYGVPIVLSARTRLSASATSIAEWHRAAIRSHRGPDTSRS